MDNALATTSTSWQSGYIFSQGLRLLGYLMSTFLSEMKAPLSSHITINVDQFSLLNLDTFI